MGGVFVMVKLIDVSGQRFGMLVVNKRVYPSRDKPTWGKWECICDCGETTLAATSDLLLEKITSCGCKKRNPSKVEIRGNLIVVIANNTEREHIFDYSRELYGKLIDRGWSESKSGHLHSGNPRTHEVECAHWLVIPRREGYDIDHRNIKPWDNRRSNLRYLTESENSFNCKLRKSNKSGYVGVYWNPRFKSYQAMISKNKKGIHLGWFKNIEDAIAARKEAELKLYPNIKSKEA
jgi:hypothetical protein